MIGFGKGDFGSGTINRGRRGEEKTVAMEPTGAFKEQYGTPDIHILVEEGIVDRGPDTGPGGEMDNVGGMMPDENCFQQGGIADVSLDQVKGGVILHGTEVFPFLLGRIIIVEIVETEYLFS